MSALKPTVNVQIIECDSWDATCNGLLETKAFRTEKQALAFIEKYNARNNLKTVPEYYTYARMERREPVGYSR